MSDLNLENIVGFKAVDKDGNEQNVTVDEMVDMVSTRMVMALSETSTFAAAAATGNDVYENELPTKSHNRSASKMPRTVAGHDCRHQWYCGISRVPLKYN